MKKNQRISIEEPFLQQEIILALTIAIGMLLMVANETVGMMVVGIGGLLLAGIYFLRIYDLIRQRREAIQCCFSWFNNGAMILAVAGILLMMLLNAFNRQIFFSGLAILFLAMVGNAIFLRYDFRAMTHISAQIRLVIALVVLAVFYLL